MTYSIARAAIIRRSPQALSSRSFFAASIINKSVTDEVKHAAKKVDKTVAGAAMKGIEAAETVVDKTKETVGLGEKRASETASEAKAKASELKGEAKGKAAELQGEAKKKANEFKS